MNGIYTMTYEQYEAAEGISKHGLDALAISPLHHWSYYRNPERGKQKDTPAKMLGNAIHVSILEPERFEKEFVKEPSLEEAKKVNPNILNTLEDYKEASKKYGLKVTGTKGQLKTALVTTGYSKDWFWDDIYESQTFGRTILSESDWRITKAITSRVRKHPAASELLNYGKAEQSIFWIDKETGVQCKGRIDWLTNDNIIIDLKSTTDASLEGFQRSITKYRYYIQAAIYVDAIAEIKNCSVPFVFAAWEKHSPYASALYYATPEMLEAGRQEYKRLLKVYAKCLESDTWPGYSQEILPIGMPEHFKPSSLSELPEEDWLEQMGAE